MGQNQQTLNALRETAAAQMEKDAHEVVGQYQLTLVKLREAAVKPLGEINDLAAQQLVKLNRQLETETRRHEENQSRLMAKFDVKLADVVSNYLTETLGNDVDLGAQGPYLFRMLEEHKSELKAELTGES